MRCIITIIRKSLLHFNLKICALHLHKKKKKEILIQLTDMQ